MSEAAVNHSVLENSQTSSNKQSNSQKSKITPNLFEQFLLAAAFLLIALGWFIKEEEILTAESGWGYALGIIGGSLMLILMLYPVRKHAKFMRNWGPVRYWFRVHMLFGVLGPAAVLYHANFGLGSVNSNVALFSMLIVACSGLIGRFVYSKIHLGLYGRKKNLAELQTEIEQSKQNIDKLFASHTKNVLQPLIQFEERFVKLAQNPLAGIFILPLLSSHSRYVRFRFQRKVNQYINARKAEKALTSTQAIKAEKILANYAKKYVTATTRVVEFVVYERIFSLWHMLHLPLFIIMLCTGIFHVYAVHMY